MPVLRDNVNRHRFSIACKAADGGIVGPPLEVVRNRSVSPTALPGVGAPDHHQPVRIAEGERLEQRRVQRAKDCCGRADTEGQRHHCDCRDAGTTS